MKYKHIPYHIILIGIFITNIKVAAQVTCVENFDFQTATTAYPNPDLPFGWSRLGAIGMISSNAWERVTVATTGNPAVFNNFAGSNAMMRFASSTATSSSVLISKPYDFRNYTSAGATVSFWMFRDSSAPGVNDNMEVLINNAPTLTGAVALTGSANPVNRPCASSPVVSCAINNWYQYTYTIPCCGVYNTSKTYILFVATPAGGANMYIDDFSITAYPLPQTLFANCATMAAQQMHDVAKGTQNNAIGCIKITADGVADSSQKVDSIILNTNGTTLPTVATDFANAKLWWTGGTSAFTPDNALLLAIIAGLPPAPPYATNYTVRPPSAATTLSATVAAGATTITVTSAAYILIGHTISLAGFPYGTVVTQISGTTITLSQPSTGAIASGTQCAFCFVLDNGDNYFWITYDVQPFATSGNYLDAEFLSVKIGSTVYNPVVATLPGARLIGMTYCGGISPLYYAGTSGYNNNYANNDFIRSIIFPGYAAVYPPGISGIYNSYAWGPAIPIPAACPQLGFCRFSVHPFDYENFNPSVIGNTATLLADSTYNYSIQCGTASAGNYVAAWIDFDHDYVFSPAEKIGQSASLNSLAWYSGTFTVPFNALAGNTTMRVREVFLGTNIDPCAPAMYGETEDYIVTIINPFSSVTENNAAPIKFKITPNPTDGNFEATYVLPKNKTGKLEVTDVFGKKIFAMMLPLNSHIQKINLNNIAAGIYSVKVSSENYFSTTKLIKL